MTRPPLHILMTADTVGGVWTYALDLCRALAAHDVHVTLATMGAAPRADQVAQVAALPNVSLHASTFKLEWMPDPWDDVRQAGDWLLDLASQTRPDVVHLNGYAHAALPWPAPVLVGAHSCVTSWWEAVKGEPAPPAWDAYRAALRQGLAAADFVVAPSRAMLDAVLRHHGPLPATRVIPNGRDPAGYGSASPKEPFVLCAGRLWDEAKNLRALEQVAPALPWPVYVAGDECLPAAGTAAAAPTTHVVPLGRLPEPDLAAWMARAAVYVLPAKYEPFGLSALEAALSGCALVLGDIPSLREVWSDAATYAGPDDPAALTNALTRLIDDAALREEMSRRATDRARDYSLATAAHSYLDVYTALTSHPARPSAPVPFVSSFVPSRLRGSLAPRIAEPRRHEGAKWATKAETSVAAEPHPVAPA